MRRIERPLHPAQQAGTDRGVLAIANGFDQQVLQTLLLKHFAQDVKHPAPECLPLGVEFLEQALEHIALARFRGHHVPEVADLGLANAMDTAKALFQPVGVPWQVVVDHQVGVLEVHALPQQHPWRVARAWRVVAEQLLDLPAILAFDPAMDGDNGRGIAEQSADLLLQIAQRVAVLGEDDQLALAPRGIAHLRGVLQQFREFVPLAILAGMHDVVCLLLQALQDADFRFELLNGLGGGGLIDHGLFELFLFLGVEVVGILGDRPAQGLCQDGCPRWRSFSSPPAA